jgi:hypothetical protein
MNILQISSFFGTMMMGELHKDILGLMTHFSKNNCNFFFTSFSSMMDYLYNPMFGKCNSEKN